MPYITFSRNAKNTAKLHKALKEKGLKDSAIERRGRKTIKKIAERAASMGFNSALLIKGAKGGIFEAQEIRIIRKGNSFDWKFGKGKKIKVS